MFIPQIDLIDEDGGKTPVIVIEQDGAMKGGTTMLKVKAGFIKNSDISIARDKTTGAVTQGTVYFKKKGSVALIQPMTYDSIAGVLTPNPSFWLSDVDVEWDSVVYDSFATSGADPSIALHVKEIGWGVTHKEIGAIRDNLLNLLFADPDHTAVSGSLSVFQKLHDFFPRKMKLDFISDLLKKGTKIMAAGRDPLGQEWGDTHRDVEHQIRLKRLFSTYTQMAILLNHELSMQLDRGEPVPYRRIGDIFTSESGIPAGGLQLGALLERHGYRAETIYFDFRLCEFVAETELTGSWGDLTRGNAGLVRLKILCRDGLENDESGSRIAARKQRLVEFAKEHFAVAKGHAAMLSGEGLYDFLQESIVEKPGSAWKMARVTKDEWAQMSVDQRRARIDETGVISESIRSNCIRMINALRTFINIIPGARAVDDRVFLARQKAFIDLIDKMMQDKTPIFQLTADGAKIMLRPSELDAILTAWREIWHDTLATVSDDGGWRKWLDTHLKGIVRNIRNELAWDAGLCRQMIEMQVCAWMVNLFSPGHGMVDLGEALMFPELQRVGAREFFNLLVRRNQDDIPDHLGWRVLQHTDVPVRVNVGTDANPVWENRHYFEIGLRGRDGVLLDASRRVGYYISDATHLNDPLNAGVTFFLHHDKSPSLVASDVFGLNEDDDPVIFDIPASTDVWHGIMSFWATLPGIGTASDAFAELVLLNQQDVRGGKRWYITKHTESAINGKHYFEMVLWDQATGAYMESSRRIGFYDGDPYIAGVTFFVNADKTASLISGQLFVTNEEGNIITDILPLPSPAPATVVNIKDFWAIIP